MTRWHCLVFLVPTRCVGIPSARAAGRKWRGAPELHSHAARGNEEREAAYLERQAPWFASVDGKAAIVLQGIGRQFGAGGTDALESPELWNVPEIRWAGGIAALKAMGKPAEVMREAKVRLFGV